MAGRSLYLRHRSVRSWAPEKFGRRGGRGSAGGPIRGTQKPAVRPAAPVSTWQVLETANFRILSYGPQPADAEVGKACERLRDELCAKWHAERGTALDPEMRRRSASQ